jgi:tetratricopeptide (TPR) repeat protein
MRGLGVDIKKVFEEGRFLEIIGMADILTSYEERLILGISMMKLGRDLDALDVFKGLYKEIENRIKSLLYIARLYQKLGDVDSARYFIQRYLAFCPDDDEAQDILQSFEGLTLLSEPSVELARLYGQQGYYKQALDIYAGLIMTKMDAEIRKEALRIQNLDIIQTLEQWLARLKR